MRRNPLRRTATLLLGAAVALGALLPAPAPVGAGGWAIGSLDAVPTAEVGATVDVGFTILQHGVTPAVLDRDVAIEMTGHDGASRFFPGLPEGAPGHYVATVTFPDEPGRYDWHLRMGWFGRTDLGSLAVTDPEPGRAFATRDLPWALLAGSLVLGIVAITDLMSRNRRPAFP